MGLVLWSRPSLLDACRLAGLRGWGRTASALWSVLLDRALAFCLKLSLFDILAGAQRARRGRGGGWAGGRKCHCVHVDQALQSAALADVFCLLQWLWLSL